MTMNSGGIIKGFNIFKYTSIGVAMVLNIKSLKLFSFDQGMEGFGACIVIRVTTMGIAVLHGFRGFTPSG